MTDDIAEWDRELEAPVPRPIKWEKSRAGVYTDREGLWTIEHKRSVWLLSRRSANGFSWEDAVAFRTFTEAKEAAYNGGAWTDDRR